MPALVVETATVPPKFYVDGEAWSNGRAHEIYVGMLRVYSRDLKWNLPPALADELATVYLAELVKGMDVLIKAINAGTKGIIYRSALVTLERNTVPVDTSCKKHGQAHGICYSGGPPYHIIIEPLQNLSRAALAWAHELIHVAEFQTRTEIDHLLLHQIAAILVSDTLKLLALPRRKA
jgi:hypothetical protein